MRLAMLVQIAALAAAASGCGSDGSSSETAPGGTMQQQSSPCDKQGSCGACQECAFAAGGPCADQVKTCEASSECVAINDCLKACLAAGGASATWDNCYAGCANAHPTGKTDYAAVVACIAADACSSDCQF